MVWHLTPRAFLSSSGLELSQLDSGFNAGLAPQLIVPTSELNAGVVTGLADYLMRRTDEHGEYPVEADVNSRFSGVSATG